MSRHARVEQRVMRRTPMFGWRLVRLDGSAVYSGLVRRPRAHERLMRELINLYASPMAFRRWLPGDVSTATVDGVPIFTDDGELNLEALKKDGWHQLGAIKED